VVRAGTESLVPQESVKICNCGIEGEISVALLRCCALGSLRRVRVFQFRLCQNGKANIGEHCKMYRLFAKSDSPMSRTS
jgi:hypothetical protein